MTSERYRVIDVRGVELAPCDAERAHKLLAAGRASLVAGQARTIRLPYAVDLPPAPTRRRELEVEPGTSLLLHICCGPCATYPVPRLRELGFDVVGWWHNPNIQPAEEHARREDSARALAARLELPLTVGAYEPERFAEAVRGCEARPGRCHRCYRLRLEAAAQEARRRGIAALTTTLLISPYQDQAALRRIGEEVAAAHGLRFFYENLRRGWTQRGRLAREYGLYQQQYCGCRFSLAEREQARRRQAARVGEGGQ
jgi:predicted adenine nucleotide alpha hydrolase (AANH) superfamily ATPase